MDIISLALAKAYANKVAAGYSSITAEGNTLIFKHNDGTETKVTIPEVEGKSAYQIWLDQGNTGTEEDFLESLKAESATNNIVIETNDEESTIREKLLSVLDENGYINKPLYMISDNQILSLKAVHNVDNGKKFVLNSLWMEKDGDTRMLMDWESYIIVPDDENSELIWDGDAMEIQNGADGADGKDGHTPVKGEDYFTEEDKQELVNLILAALPNSEEVNY